MSNPRRQIRELALQALYQYELRGEVDAEQIALSVQDAPQPPELRQRALEIAKLAWATRDGADAMATELAPDWPTHRQPVVDRSILRLGYYEIASGLTPPAVAINEAIELAKTFGGERSPAFVNGVLDKMAQRLRESAAPKPPAAPPLPTSHDEQAWLDDAMKHNPKTI